MKQCCKITSPYGRNIFTKDNHRFWFLIDEHIFFRCFNVVQVAYRLWSQKSFSNCIYIIFIHSHRFIHSCLLLYPGLGGDGPEHRHHSLNASYSSSHAFKHSFTLRVRFHSHLFLDGGNWRTWKPTNIQGNLRVHYVGI